MKTRLRLPDPKKAKRFFAKKMAFTTGPMELSRCDVPPKNWAI